MSCLNCGIALAQQDAKFFLGVLVCESCQHTADRVLQERMRMLQRLLTAAKEDVRIMLTTGKLHLGPLKPREGEKNRPLFRPIPTIVEELHAARGRTGDSHPQDQPESAPADSADPGSSGEPGVGDQGS